MHRTLQYTPRVEIASVTLCRSLVVGVDEVMDAFGVDGVKEACRAHVFGSEAGSYIKFIDCRITQL